MSPPTVILVAAVPFPYGESSTLSSLIGFRDVVNNCWLAGIFVVATWWSEFLVHLCGCLMIVFVTFRWRYLPKHFQTIKPRLDLHEWHFIINLYSCNTLNVDCALTCLAVTFRPCCEMLVTTRLMSRNYRTGPQRMKTDIWDDTNFEMQIKSFWG